MASEEEIAAKREAIRQSSEFWERVMDAFQATCTHPKEFEGWIPGAAGGGTYCTICDKTLHD